MTTLKLIASLLVASALPIASARTYSIRLYSPLIVSGQELAPGEYALDVKDSKIVIRGHGKQVEAAAQVHNEQTKWDTNAVRYDTTEKGSEVREIRLGGTKLHIVLGEPLHADVTPVTGAKATYR